MSDEQDRLFHIPLLVSPSSPTVCILQVARAPLSLTGELDANDMKMSPSMNDVEIELWEADRLLPDGGNKNDYLATLVVDLKLEKSGTIRVTEKELRLESKSDDQIELGVLELGVDLGGGKHGPIRRIPIYGAETEWPHSRPGWAKPRATTELALTVRSDYPDETTQTELSLLKTGFLPAGPVAAFICLEPDQSEARSSAEEYWNEHADIIYIAGSPDFDGSLPGIAELLESHNRLFQEVNIIGHGSEDGLMLFQREDDEGNAVQEWRSHDALVVEAMGALDCGNAFDRQHSRVVVRGCTVGRDRRLLLSLSQAFDNVRVYGAADRVLYLYTPPGGRPEYYVLHRYFTPVAGKKEGHYLDSASKTSAVLSADTRHGSGCDFKTWTKVRESHWSGKLPRFFRNARQLSWSSGISGVKSKAAGREAFEQQSWAEIQSGDTQFGKDQRYRLATFETRVDVSSMSWSGDPKSWAAAHDWEFTDSFDAGQELYMVVFHRTHVVAEVLVTDPPNDPRKGTPVPLDLETHMVSVQASP